MKMNFKMFKNLVNPAEVIEVQGREVEVHFMNETNYLAQYAGQGYFFAWASDGNSYKLLVERGYYETLHELFLPDVCALQIKLYEDLSTSRKRIYLGLLLPVFVIIVALLIGTLIIEQLTAYTTAIAIGGLILFLVVNIFQSSYLRKRVEKLRNNYFGELEEFFGEEKLDDLIVRQRDYHANYFNFDEEDVEEELVYEEVEEEHKELQEEKVVPLWVSEPEKDEEDKPEELVLEDQHEEDQHEEDEPEEEQPEEQHENSLKEELFILKEEKVIKKPVEPKQEQQAQEIRDVEVDLSILLIEELKGFAKERKIVGFSTMRKSELVEALPGEYEALRVVELQALARTVLIPNFSTMRKLELIEALKLGPAVVEALPVEEKPVVKEEKVIREAGEVDLNVLTMEELKGFTKDRKVSGFSTMRKAELIEALPNTYEALKVVELQALARALEIPDFSTMRKLELIEALRFGPAVEEALPVEEKPVVKEEKVLKPKAEPKPLPQVEALEGRTQVVAEDGTVDLNVLTVDELKVFAKERKVLGFSTMRKIELVEVLPNNISELRLTELKALGRAYELNNFSTMRKEELTEELIKGIPLPAEPIKEAPVEKERINVLNEDGTVNLNLLTLEELKEFVKERKIAGFSTMRKAELIAALPQIVEDLKTIELKALARVGKVPNFSVMRKQELINAIKENLEA